jgi:hypothetical protein
MIDKRSPFYAYRYLVSPINSQTTIIQYLNSSKEELMKSVINNLTFDTKTEYTKGNKRYLFYGVQEFDEIHIIKFARETNEKLYIEGENDIEIQGIKEAKYVYLIIDTKNQIILLERNNRVFQQIESAIEILATYFREKMIIYDYVVNVYPLVSKKKFWSYVESADEIYELSLELNAPNLFFGNSDTREILKEIKDVTNNETFDISFKNKEGKLKVAQESLGKYIDYVREVGGKYLLKFMRNGVREVKTSLSDTAKTYIERKKTEKYSSEELLEIREKLTHIHTLETRDEQDE